MPGKQCAAIGCKNSEYWTKKNNEEKNYTFHSFPKDPDIRLKWTQFVRRANWVPTKHAVLCSEHFTKEDFYVPFKNRGESSGTRTPLKMKLKRGVKPTVEISSNFCPPERYYKNFSSHFKIYL